MFDGWRYGFDTERYEREREAMRRMVEDMKRSMAAYTTPEWLEEQRRVPRHRSSPERKAAPPRAYRRACY